MKIDHRSLFDRRKEDIWFEWEITINDDVKQRIVLTPVDHNDQINFAEMALSAYLVSEAQLSRIQNGNNQKVNRLVVSTSNLSWAVLAATAALDTNFGQNVEL
jgi:hypothetical protein